MSHNTGLLNKQREPWPSPTPLTAESGVDRTGAEDRALAQYDTASNKYVPGPIPGDALGVSELGADRRVLKGQLLPASFDVHASDHGVVGDKTTDDTAALQAAHAAAAMIGTPDRPAVLLIPPGDYLSDVVIPASNVDVWGYGATIWKRSDSTGSPTDNTLWRTLETLSFVANGTGDTHSNATVDNVTGTWITGQNISGPGIPAGATVTAVVGTTLTISAPATATATGVAVARGTYYGTHANVCLRGLTFEGDGKLCGNSPSFAGTMLRFFYVENLLLEDITVASYSPNSWAVALGGTGRVRGLRIRGGSNLTEDGLHIEFGDWTVEDYDIESGDDSISVGAQADDPYVAADPQNVSRVSIGRGRCVSELVSCLKLYTLASSPPWATIRRVSVEYMDGWAKTGPPVWLNDQRGDVAGASQIIAPVVQGKFRKGDSPNAASSTVTNGDLLAMTNVDDAVIDIEASYSQDASALAGWRLGRVTDCRSPDVTIRCSSLPKSGGIEFTRCLRPRVRGEIVSDGVNTNNALVILTDCPDTEIAGRLLNQKSGQALVSVVGGTTTTIKAIGGKWSHVPGFTAGAGHVLALASASYATFVEMKDVDLRDADLDVSSAPSRPLGSNFSSVAGYEIANCPGLHTKVRGNTTIGSAVTSVTLNIGVAGSAHIDLISVRQVDGVWFRSDPGSITKHWLDEATITSTTVAWKVNPAPGASVTGYYIIDVGRKPAT